MGDSSPKKAGVAICKFGGFAYTTVGSALRRTARERHRSAPLSACAIGYHMTRILGKFESLVNAVLLVFIAVVVLITTFQLGEEIVVAVTNRPLLHFNSGELLGIFSSFLLVLIGVELMHTVKIYLLDKSVQVEVILAVGLVAITRKVVVLDPKQLDGPSLVGIAAIIVALSISYYLVRLSDQKRAGD
jgi:uncharacterized membrane protein (DUF373 family)